MHPRVNRAGHTVAGARAGWGARDVHFEPRAVLLVEAPLALTTRWCVGPGVGLAGTPLRAAADNNARMVCQRPPTSTGVGWHRARWQQTRACAHRTASPRPLTPGRQRRLWGPPGRRQPRHEQQTHPTPQTQLGQPPSRLTTWGRMGVRSPARAHGSRRSLGQGSRFPSCPHAGVAVGLDLQQAKYTTWMRASA